MPTAVGTHDLVRRNAMSDAQAQSAANATRCLMQSIDRQASRNDPDALPHIEQTGARALGSVRAEGPVAAPLPPVLAANTEHRSSQGLSLGQTPTAVAQERKPACRKRNKPSVFESRTASSGSSTSRSSMSTISRTSSARSSAATQSERSSASAQSGVVQQGLSTLQQKRGRPGTMSLDVSSLAKASVATASEGTAPRGLSRLRLKFQRAVKKANNVKVFTTSLMDPIGSLHHEIQATRKAYEDAMAILGKKAQVSLHDSATQSPAHTGQRGKNWRDCRVSGSTTNSPMMRSSRRSSIINQPTSPLLRRRSSRRLAANAVLCKTPSSRRCPQTQTLGPDAVPGNQTSEQNSLLVSVASFGSPKCRYLPGVGRRFLRVNKHKTMGLVAPAAFCGSAQALNEPNEEQWAGAFSCDIGCLAQGTRPIAPWNRPSVRF